METSPPFEGTVTLRVIEGAGKGQALVLDDSVPGRILIGRGPACGLRIEDVQISRRHAAIEIVGESVVLRDVGSTNGTFVNGVKIVEAVLDSGQEVRVGPARLVVERAVSGPKAEVPSALGFGRLLGQSREMRRLYPLCRKLAQGRAVVLLEGETGTGKEVLAEALHEEGPRAKGPFVVFDCTTVPANLMESELFGHERGAFTGANQTHVGLLEQAAGGALLIDEIGDLELPLQGKLLRVLEKLEFRRVGGSKVMRADVRILAATRRDLDREVQAGRFRDDLFHRLTVARVELPPLRRRQGDVPLLVAEFCRQLGVSSSVLPPDVLARWIPAEWPGNVRELRNAVVRRIELGEHADVMTASAEVRALPREGADDANDVTVAGAVASILSTDLPLLAARQRLIDEFDRQYIARVLERHGGNVSRAAEASGIARRHFHRLIARLKQ